MERSNRLRTSCEVRECCGREKAFSGRVFLVYTTANKYDESERYQEKSGHGQPCSSVQANLSEQQVRTLTPSVVGKAEANYNAARAHHKKDTVGLLRSESMKHTFNDAQASEVKFLG